MKQWSIEFWENHGERLIFMGGATLFSVAFMLTKIQKLSDAGEVILIGVAMLLYNKARSKPNGAQPDEEQHR